MKRGMRRWFLDAECGCQSGPGGHATRAALVLLGWSGDEGGWRLP